MTDPEITDAEYRVMQVLWAQSPLTAVEIADRLSATTGWGLTTVKTLISRLCEKNALTHQRDGRRFLYAPALSHANHASKKTRDLVDRLFGGRAAPLVAHLANHKDGLSPSDIEELEALLEELKSDD